MNLLEYEQHGRQLYEQLARVVGDLLKHALDAEGGYRLQQTQHRAKSVSSLQKRLEEAQSSESDEIELIRKDLAGCRLVFYTNKDVSRFTQSRMLSDLFEIDGDRSKIHHPAPGATKATDLFRSFNYVVRLRADRTDLLEYRHLSGLWCEVQVQTTLNHAWADTAHDMIYKRPELGDFGKQEMLEIEQRLSDVMRKHLIPAGYIFQKIINDFDRLAAGKTLFDEGAIDAVVNTDDNNERYNAVNRLKDYVLPYFDDVPNEYPGICEKLKEAWIRAEDTPVTPRQTPFGDYRGETSDRVTGVIKEIFQEYRYLDVHATYGLICELFVKTKVQASRDQLLKLSESLSAYTLQVWEHCGPAVQVELVDRLKSHSDRQAIAPVAIKILEEVLKPDITGTTSSSNALTLHSAAILYSDALAGARQDSIRMLSELAEQSANEDDKRLALSTLFNATAEPRYQLSDDSVMAMIIRDSAMVVDVIANLSVTLSLEMRQHFEDRILNYSHHYRALHPNYSGKAKIEEAHTILLSSINDARRILNEDEEFVIFKTLVGFESVFPHMWEDERFDFNKNAAYRDAEQNRLAQSVNTETWNVWKRRVVRAANVKSQDGATFPPLKKFLDKLAALQPKLVLDLLEDREAMPRWTVSLLARALWEHNQQEETNEVLTKWVDEGRLLREIAEAHIFCKHADATLVQRLAEQAISRRDENACVALAEAAARQFQHDRALWRDRVFFPCMEVLHELRSLGWINRTWCDAADETSLFASLDERQVQSLLAALLMVPEIDYHEEYILAALAKRFPKIVLDWFGSRLARSKDETVTNYSAIPYSFSELREVLKLHPQEILIAVRNWYDAAETKGARGISYFLNRVYPEFDQALIDHLGTLVDQDDADTLQFLVEILKGFKGRKELLPLLRQILLSPAAPDNIERSIQSLIEETGVTSGEFGLVQAYLGKAEMLEPWLQDGSDRVKRFAKSLIDGLKNRAASENRWSEQEQALRRLRYGEPPV